MIGKRMIYVLLGLAIGCADTGRSRSPPSPSSPRSGNIEDVVADAGDRDGDGNNSDDVVTSYDTPPVNSDATDTGNDDTYDAGFPDPDAGNDSGNEYMVNGEEEGIQIIVTELAAQGYFPEVRSDHWSTIRLRNPQTGEYDLVLEPDVRFRRGRSPPAYSFFEFNSREDPGIGMTSNIPFYREVQPATEEEIRAYIQRSLRDL